MKNRPKPRRTPEERKAIVTALAERLEAYLGETAPETLAAFVAQFDGYSDRNAYRIGMQRPGATDVRGYREWLAHGRQVRKGETGIAILAPITRVGDGDDPELVSVRVVYVFDVEQTDPIEPPQTGDAA